MCIRDRANLYLALEQNLHIIPIVNKIDLPAADIKKVKSEIIRLLGCDEDEIFCASGKTGEGVKEILEAIIENGEHPKEPKIETDKEFSRSLIFDSKYD